MMNQEQLPHHHHTYGLPGSQTLFNHHQRDMGVVKEGSMCVQSQTLWRRWSWDRKYMVLTHDYLQYIEHCTTTTTTPHTPPPQQQHTTLYLHGDVSLTIDEERRGVNLQHHVRVKSQKQNKCFNMYCLNQEERDDWMTKILLVLAAKHTEDMNDGEQPCVVSKRRFKRSSRYGEGGSSSSSRTNSIKSNFSRCSNSSKSSRGSADEQNVRLLSYQTTSGEDSRHVCVVSCFLSEHLFLDEKETMNKKKRKGLDIKRSFSNHLQLLSPISTPTSSKVFRRHSFNSKQTANSSPKDVMRAPLSSKLSRKWSSIRAR